MNTGTMIRSLAAPAIVVGAAVMLAACSAGTAATSAPSVAPIEASTAPISLAPSDTPSTEPSTSEAGSSVEASAEPTAIATSIDPCQIVTVDEVNKLTGGSYTSGKEGTAPDNVKRCTYTGPTGTFTVVAAVAPDAATAKKSEADMRAQLEAQANNLPLKLTELPSFAPGADAAVVDGSVTLGGSKIAGIAIYVLRNTTFFGITDISGPGATPPTAAQMEDQAKVTLGRVP